MQLRSLMVAFIFAVTSFGAVKAVTAQEMQFSSGQTQYQSADGQWVGAYVQLQGSQGTYQTNFGAGQLYNVQYHQFPTGVTISGNWAFGGQGGVFSWQVGYNYSFGGEWWFQPSQRWSWSGQLTPSGGGNCGYPGGPACPGGGGGNNNCGYPGGPVCG